MASEESSCHEDDYQTCATDIESLGTTHCGSAVGKYRDEHGYVRQGFWRGCISCDGKFSLAYHKLRYSETPIYEGHEGV